MPNYSEDIAELLTDAVQASREKSLYELIEQLMVALAKKDYQFDEVLDALANYAHKREDWNEVVKKLEESALEIKTIRKRLS